MLTKLKIQFYPTEISIYKILIMLIHFLHSHFYIILVQFLFYVAYSFNFILSVCKYIIPQNIYFLLGKIIGSKT